MFFWGEADKIAMIHFIADLVVSYSVYIRKKPKFDLNSIIWDFITFQFYYNLVIHINELFINKAVRE